MRSVQYCAKLTIWEKSIRNHVYWSIQSADGDGDLAYERIMSSLMHICGIHDDFQKVSKYSMFIAK